MPGEALRQEPSATVFIIEHSHDGYEYSISKVCSTYEIARNSVNSHWVEKSRNYFRLGKEKLTISEYDVD